MRIYTRFVTIILFVLLNSLIAQESGTKISDQNSEAAGLDSTFATDSLWVSQQSDYINTEVLGIVYTIIFIILAFIVIMYMRQPLQKLSEKSNRYAPILTQIIPIILLISWILVLLIIVWRILDLSLIASLAFFLIIGFAFALAVKDILKDVIAGFIVPFEKHLQKGYKIRVGDVWGEIEGIGIRKSILKTNEGRLIVIPNHSLLTAHIKDIYTEKDNYPVKIDFYLHPASDLNRCREIVYKAAIISSHLYLDKPVNINYSNHFVENKSVVRLRLEAYLRNIESEKNFTNELTEMVAKDLINASKISDPQ